MLGRWCLRLQNSELKSNISGIRVKSDPFPIDFWVAFMSSQAIDDADGSAQPSWRELVIPGWLFAGLASLLVMSLILLGWLAVVAITYAGTETHPDRMFDRVWALLSLLALLWALVNLHWMSKAAEAGSTTAVYAHLAMAIGCGLIGLGIHAVFLARTIASRPLVLDYSHRVTTAGGVAAAPTPPSAGNAEEGRKIFSTTCVTCHGPTGGGLPNLAPSLRGSSFLASADAAAIANVIRLGRAATDPNNKTKKVMPARGGNPFLGDDKIAHLVAFVQDIQKQGPTSGADVQGSDAAAPVQLARWVVPQAPPPPTGLKQDGLLKSIGSATAVNSRNAQRRLQLVRSGSMGLTGIHFLFLTGVMVASSQILLRGLVTDPARQSSEATCPDKTLWSWTTLAWVIAAVAWLVMFLFGFVMT